VCTKDATLELPPRILPLNTDDNGDGDGDGDGDGALERTAFSNVLLISPPRMIRRDLVLLAVIGIVPMEIEIDRNRNKDIDIDIDWLLGIEYLCD